jgi:asparagine synthase (glutamine-hydrolysing)
MQARASRPVRTFTVGFEDPAFDESGHARAVARHLGTDHTEIRLTAREAMEVVPSLPSVYGEPFADPSQIPTLLVSRLARQQVSVALSGDGGDELFAGYSRYRAARALWGPWSRLPPGWRATAAAALRLARPQAWGASSAPGVFGGALNKGSRPWARRLAASGDRLHKIAGVLESPDVDSFYRRVRSQWSEADAAVCPPLDRTAFGQKRSVQAGGSIAAAGDIDDVEAIASQSWPGMEADDQAVSGLDGVGNSLPGEGGGHPAADRDADAFVHRMMATDLLGYLPDHVLTKVDRAAMATGLETRVPMLSPDLLAFAWQLPMACKWRDGSTKWVLRQVLARHVPDSLIDRPKQGFGVPLGDWLRGPLRPWAQELLEPARLAREGYLHPASIQCLWADHLGGHHDRGYALWNVLMFQAWLEHSGREDRATSPQGEGIGEGGSEGIPSVPVQAPAFERRRA